MSRGKAGAIQMLKEELEHFKESHEKEKKELRDEWEEEMKLKLQSFDKDKQRHVKIVVHRYLLLRNLFLLKCLPACPTKH